MTSQLQFIGILLLTVLPSAECNDGTPFLSVGGVVAMIIFTCFLCMCYRRMYEQRIAMAEAAHAPRAVIITARVTSPSSVQTPVTSPAHITGSGGIRMPYSPSLHYNPYGQFHPPITPLHQPTEHPTTQPEYPPPPSYESLFPPRNTQTADGNQPTRNNAGS